MGRCLRRARRAQEGTPAELLAREGLYRQMAERQQ